MHSFLHRWFSTVLLSASLGWTPPSAGPAAPSGGQAAASVSPLARTERAPGAPVSAVWQDGKAGRPGQPPNPMPVQAPPLPPQRAENARRGPRLQAPALTPAPGNPVAVISTSLGDLTIELFKDKAPASVENFVQYANEGFYSDTIFHRVKPAFMIQGGGFTATLVEKPTRRPIQNEATNGLRNTRGTVAMARRATLRSATSQFYINLVDNRSLDHSGYSPAEFGYAVFGRVLSGMDVADRIGAVPTRSSVEMDDVPVEPVVIKSVRVLKSAGGRGERAKRVEPQRVGVGPHAH